jgi:hypothetical protein
MVALLVTIGKQVLTTIGWSTASPALSKQQYALAVLHAWESRMTGKGRAERFPFCVMKRISWLPFMVEEVKGVLRG